MGIQYLGDDGPDGTVVFQSGQTGGFYGATPVARQTTPSSVTSTAITVAVTTAITGPVSTAAISSTATAYGYTTSTQADAIVTAINSLIARVASVEVAVNSVRTNLREVGLMA